MTWRKRFLAAMDDLVPWGEVSRLVGSSVPAAWRRHTVPMDALLRIFLMQYWFGYTSEEVRDALIRWRDLRNFAGLCTTHAVPDVQTIAGFETALWQAGVTGLLFELTLGKGAQLPGSAQCCGRMNVAVP